MSRRTRTRIGAAVLTLVAAMSLVFVSAGAANASHEERSLQLTRVDGSPVGTLFTDWVMVPGDKVSTTLLAHRTGAGESSLLITLGDSDHGTKRPATPVEEDVIITAEANGLEIHSSAATLMKSDAALDLGRSSEPVVPITVTFELPFSSSNATSSSRWTLWLWSWPLTFRCPPRNRQLQRRRQRQRQLSTHRPLTVSRRYFRSSPTPEHPFVRS
jgi:hypothetical protein